MDLGPMEIITLLLIGVLMFGPEKLPPIARKVARVYRYLSNIANDARGQLANELGPGFADLTLADLNPKTFIAKHLLDTEEVSAVRDALNETKSAVSEVNAELAAASASAKTAGQELVGVLNADGGLQPVGVPFDLEAT